MDIRYWFIGWKKENIFWTAGLLLTVLLVIFVSLNIGVGSSQKVKGKVSAFGLDTATRHELSIPMITVELENGRLVTVEGMRGINLRVGDEVELLEAGRFITSGSEYKFYRKGN